jgi:hypothetical protein
LPQGRRAAQRNSAAEQGSCDQAGGAAVKEGAMHVPGFYRRLS